MGGTENRLHPPGGWGRGWGTGQWEEVGGGGGEGRKQLVPTCEGPSSERQSC